jgi:hypothetical protein
MLWEAYSRRQAGNTDESSEEATGTIGSPEEVELPSSPPPYALDDAMKSVGTTVEERLMEEA